MLSDLFSFYILLAMNINDMNWIFTPDPSHELRISAKFKDENIVK